MLFNSYIFWFFFVIVILLYRVLPHRLQNRMLLIASYIFYGYWDCRFLSLIFISTVIDYFVANKIVRFTDLKRKKQVLLISLVANLGMLGFFKYYGFFIQEFTQIMHLAGIPFSTSVLRVVLPVGISFYTFQTLSYTIDVYRGQTKPTKNFMDFALYVSFFPQLVAGPIERSYRLMPQVLSPRKLDFNNFSEGLYHVLSGLFKKVIIADNMAPIVNMVFSQNPAELSGGDVLVGVYAFAFQIYGDFSGYSSIAQGIAKWMGFDLMWNFKMPYFAISPSDFWKRWHISLSSWLRDYLYIPLGGNRGGKFFLYRNLMVTMVLGGLWHGAGWTFINWGIFHGLLLIGYRIFSKKNKKTDSVRFYNFKYILKVIVMFHLVCISWLLFRAESMSQVWYMLTRLIMDFHFTEFTWYALGMIAFFTGPLIIFEYILEKSGDLLLILKVNWLARGSVYSYLIIMVWIFPPLINQEFIYFQF